MSEKNQNSHITGGELRGGEILSPKKPQTHPMSSRARLGLFNSLRSIMDLNGAKVLDMYAGSGALGFEALSRGAEKVIFVEKDWDAVKTIMKTADKLDVKDKVEIIRGNVKWVNLKGEHFDLILVDPPYRRFNPDEWSDFCGALPERMVVAVSHPPMPVPGNSLFVVSDKKYSGCQIAIFKYPTLKEQNKRFQEMLSRMSPAEFYGF